MTKIKLTKDDINKAFDEALSGGKKEQGKPLTIAEQIEQIAARNKGVKPQ